MTIAADGNALVLVGFTYDWYDTLDLAVQGACVVNLITGPGLLNQGEAQAETRFQTTPVITEIQN